MDVLHSGSDVTEMYITVAELEIRGGVSVTCVFHPDTVVLFVFQAVKERRLERWIFMATRQIRKMTSV